ncbi:MAG: sensor domain-containing diguanylate cyclase [Blastocatellia bacterium]|nr:sensor domain-containing diguanylate cyclase [Blastocatellia bacterium]
MRDGIIPVSIFEDALRLHESLDISQVIERAMKLLPTVVDAESWAVFLKAEQGDCLEMVRAVNASALAVSPFVKIESAYGPVARAVYEQKTIITAGEEQPSESDSQSGGARATLCIPLVFEKRLIGAVQATRSGPRDSEVDYLFTGEDARVAELVCRSMAVALANAIDYHNATRQTLIDDLTRLYNVRYLYQMLDNEIRRARRYGSPVSIVFMDLDGFKLVNDAYGHRAGSATLTEVARIIMNAVREADFVARYGGDEFVIMLPETSAKRAVEVAERVRSEITAHRFTGGVGADIYLTASFGVASFPEHATEAEKLIELADAAMYAAKERNKNSVRLAAS